MDTRQVRARRATTPDEAMGVLRGEKRRVGVVEANTGDQVVALRRTRYGSIEAEVFIEELSERRWVPVTDKQARKIVYRARRPDEGGDTLRLVPPENYPEE
ncbi:hypothetical protein HALG_00016 [Halorubrum virus CGphi46]|uniref:Uncharacterized protein n=1 Tax=Halorubrum virus CGphi46 TaxID=754066 RepID=R9TQM9_9CAUD|nr:hypothetical protein HALG_00016 [Halorubrum virus CGphi46]AGN33804.1 hypothetical protein HALG_00016 [Halorubrum virus CGphi46]